MTSFMLKRSSYNFNCLFHGHRKQDSRGNCKVGAICAFLCYQNIPFTNLCWQPKVWGCIQFNRFIESLRIHQSGSSIQYLSMVLSAELEGGSILAEQLSHLMITLVLFKSLYKLVSKTVKRPQGVIMNKIHWKYIWTSQGINKYLFYMNSEDNKNLPFIILKINCSHPFFSYTQSYHLLKLAINKWRKK